MTSYSRTLASLTVCAAFGLGGGACGGGSADPGPSGSAGDSGAGTAGTGAGGTTGNAGATGRPAPPAAPAAAARPAAPAPTAPAACRSPPGGLFVSLAGKTQADVNTKLTTAVNRFFGIGTGESTTPTAATGYRCYYELPQDASMAFIWAADSDDVRSEGMSYGMMIAVQMNMQAQFDRLWKFAKTYMQFPGNSGMTAWRYYFKWQGTVNRSSATSWTATFSDATGPAPDGDEYFAAALYLAHKRWGIDRRHQLQAGGRQHRRRDVAQHIHVGDGRGPIIHASQNMPVFYPQGASGNFTDPSYHLPAFYELFAADGPAGDAARWRIGRQPPAAPSSSPPRTPRPGLTRTTRRSRARRRRRRRATATTTSATTPGAW